MRGREMARVRGSELLKQRWSEADLIKVVDLEHAGVELVEFFPKGIPAPDGGWGTWHVQPAVLPHLLETLIKNGLVPGIRIFPKGIPYPDVFEVMFEAGSARVR